MVEKMFVEVCEINLKFFYLHILIVFFPCGFKDFYGIYWHNKKGVTHLEMNVKNKIKLCTPIIMSKVWQNQNKK
jgi:hypothetical protein